MGIKLGLFILVWSLSFGLSQPALAFNSDKLPKIPGAKEKPCAEDETGTCLETPKKRFELTTSVDIGSVVKELLRLSKEKGWKMFKVHGLKDPRYQSRNSQGFSFMWSVESLGKLKKPGGSAQMVYHIYYWQISGE